MDLKERIQELCKQKGISMNQLEQELGFGKGYISKLGKSTPNTAKIQQIALFFGVTVDYLMTGKKEQEEKKSELTIGNNIRRKREELGLTQEELAKLLGYKSKSTINKIEMGINDISQSKVMNFAEVLNTTPAELMGWTNENDKNQLTQKDEREIGHDLDRIMEELENDVDGPLFYNGEPIDDGSLELLRKALELGLSQLKRENKLKYGRKKKDD